MTELGLIRPAHNGTFYLLPMLQRAVTKMTSLVDKHMASIDAQRMSLPVLTSSELWSKTGRLESIGREIMTSVDRHNHSQILSPVNFDLIRVFGQSLTSSRLVSDRRGKRHSLDCLFITDILQTATTSPVSGS